MCIPPILVSLALAGIAGGAWTAAGAASLRAASVAAITVYLAPSSKGGSDQHTGLSPSSPVLTLARAQQVLQQRNPTGNVEVRIEQGTYVAGQTRWTFYVPGHTISFLPVNYVVGKGRPPGGDPVFTDTTLGRAHTAGWWLQAQEPASGPLHDGGTTGLRFYYLRVQDYTNGISFDGQAGHASKDHQNPPMYIKPSAGVNGNTVFGMTFADLGDLFAPGQTGFGAILLTDSSGNRITNNTFDHIENAAATAGKIHGIYVTHFSSSNSITANKFTTISSYAVKVRDRSNFNDVEHNRFDATGGSSAYRDEFCDLACARANPGTPRQCASYGNRFFYNTIGTVFGGTARQNAWSLSPPGLIYAGGSGCSIPSGQQRLRTGGNT
jgi:Right handed beta helix region